jgi:hypothetical protein
MAEVDKADGHPEGGQGAGLDPIRDVLRRTYDAENHDSLGNDLTGLMLQLAVVGDELQPGGPQPASRAAAASARPRRWWERLFAPVAPR